MLTFDLFTARSNLPPHAFVWALYIYVGKMLRIHILDISIIQLNRNLPDSVAQLDAPSDWRPGGCGFKPRRGRQHSFVEIDREIFSTAILFLPLIQEGQLPVLAKECAQYWLTA